MTKQISIKIDPMGNPVVEALGFSGSSCEAATKPIEDALGGGAVKKDMSMKPEYTESAGIETQQTW